MTSTTPLNPPKPPSQHLMALMIWLAVTPTLLVINLTIGPVLSEIPTVPRTLIIATLAVPIVIYGLMPVLHTIRRRVHGRRAS